MHVYGSLWMQFAMDAVQVNVCKLSGKYVYSIPNEKGRFNDKYIQRDIYA